MTRKKLIVITLVAFLGLEAILIWFALRIAPYFIERREVPIKNLRLGILPMTPKGMARERWRPFFDQINKKFADLNFKPCFASSKRELLNAFKSSSLDLIIVEADEFQELRKSGLEMIMSEANSPPLFKKSGAAVAIGYIGENNVKNQGLMAALVTIGADYVLGETRDTDLVTANPDSLAGCRVQMAYLRRNLPETPKRWFARAEHAGDEYQALRRLLDGEADIAAVSRQTLALARRKDGADGNELKILWMQGGVPEKIICFRSDIADDFPPPPNDGKKHYALEDRVRMCFKELDYAENTPYQPRVFNLDEDGYPKRLENLPKLLSSPIAANLTKGND